jgi:endonuclease YncB( thermonuclease family)
MFFSGTIMPAKTACLQAAIAFTLISACSAPSCAERYRGTVTQVVDGDTLVVRSLEQHISVQLEGIDAPDTGEPYAKRSAQSLAQLCVQRSAEILGTGSDEYGRVLGTVECNGINVNEMQLQRGFARLDATANTPPSWQALQDEARRAHRGLWSGN